ncbi:hypothetical protein NUSPORA_00400 [Nucleospora cyclopteri]
MKEKTDKMVSNLVFKAFLSKLRSKNSKDFSFAEKVYKDLCKELKRESYWAKWKDLREVEEIEAFFALRCLFNRSFKIFPDPNLPEKTILNVIQINELIYNDLNKKAYVFLYSADSVKLLSTEVECVPFFHECLNVAKSLQPLKKIIIGEDETNYDIRIEEILGGYKIFKVMRIRLFRNNERLHPQLKKSKVNYETENYYNKKGNQNIINE